jgi:hypothetical protein
MIERGAREAKQAGLLLSVAHLSYSATCWVLPSIFRFRELKMKALPE